MSTTAGTVYVHFEKSTESTNASAPLGMISVFSVVVVDTIDDRCDCCPGSALLVVQNVATDDRRKLLPKLSRTPLIGRGLSICPICPWLPLRGPVAVPPASELGGGEGAGLAEYRSRSRLIS